MLQQLKNQVAIVTGGNGGIGRALCERFANLGAAVISLDLAHADWPESMKAVLRIDVDLTNEAAVKQAFAEVQCTHEYIDILVNNAGFYHVPRRPFWEIDFAEWEKVFAINVNTVFLCTREVSTLMRNRGKGRIVNISSNVVTFGMPNLMHYVAAKAAVVGITRAMASELGSFGVTVNAVAPGLVPTAAARALTPQKVFDDVIVKQRIKHHVSAEDIAAAVIHFCLPESRSITGQTLLVNCGDGFAGI